MTITRETVELAARNADDLAAARAKAVEVRTAEQRLEIARASDEASLKGLRSELWGLQARAAESGDAVRAIEQSIPRELVAAVEFLGAGTRAAEIRVKEARSYAIDRRRDREHLAMQGAPRDVLDDAMRTLIAAEADLAERTTERDALAARLAQAEAEAAKAVEAAKAEALREPAAVS